MKILLILLFLVSCGKKDEISSVVRLIQPSKIVDFKFSYSASTNKNKLEVETDLGMKTLELPHNEYSFFINPRSEFYYLNDTQVLINGNHFYLYDLKKGLIELSENEVRFSYIKDDLLIYINETREKDSGTHLVSYNLKNHTKTYHLPNYEFSDYEGYRPNMKLPLDKRILVHNNYMYLLQDDTKRLCKISLDDLDACNEVVSDKHLNNLIFFKNKLLAVSPMLSEVNEETGELTPILTSDNLSFVNGGYNYVDDEKLILTGWVYTENGTWGDVGVPFFYDGTELKLDTTHTHEYKTVFHDNNDFFYQSGADHTFYKLSFPTMQMETYSIQGTVNHVLKVGETVYLLTHIFNQDYISVYKYENGEFTRYKNLELGGADVSEVISIKNNKIYFLGDSSGGGMRNYLNCTADLSLYVEPEGKEIVDNSANVSCNIIFSVADEK